MDGQYPPPIPPLNTLYHSGYPPMMSTETLRPRLQPLSTLSIDGLGTYYEFEEPGRAMLPSKSAHRARRRQNQGSEHVKHRRTRSGCYTCRQRRVKCDENHPICNRCRKGKRECTYPGSTSSPNTTRPSASGTKTKDSPDASSPSNSDEDEDEPMTLSAIVDENEGSSVDGEQLSTTETTQSQPLDATARSRRNNSTSSVEPTKSSSMRTTGRPKVKRSTSRLSVKADQAQSQRWASLPEDVKYYLTYHRENLSHHHYALKYDGSRFLSTTFIEIALNDGSAALLYSIVAFAAYHHTVSRDDDKISVFLSYYNKSITHLSQLLKNKRHSVVTLLTILQLATIEEFLGDWLNLMGHQKAAYQILIDIFTPETIMQDETRRQIINWYLRFDLFAGMMSGEKTILGREWFAAALEFYKRQTRDRPNDLGAKFEEYFATSRLLATDVTLLLSARTQGDLNDDQFATKVKKLQDEFLQFGNLVESTFTSPNYFVKTFPKAPPQSDNDIVDYRDPNFLYAGELATMNFVLMDHWAIDLMFKHQLSLVMSQPPSPELTHLALKKLKMFEAIQFGDATGPAAALGAQASLGILALFLPKDEKHITWCRRKFADIEKLGYIYPATFRSQMTQMWNQDVMAWWLPSEDGCPGTLRTIKDFVDSRAPRATDSWASGIRDMSGVFGSLNIDERERAALNEMNSAGAEGSAANPWNLEGQPWT